MCVSKVNTPRPGPATGAIYYQQVVLGKSCKAAHYAPAENYFAP